MNLWNPLRVGLALAVLLPLAIAPSPPDTAPPSPGASAPDPDPRVLEELDRGRHWHASRLLERKGSGGSVVLRARAEAGWQNWPEVWALLKKVKVEEVPEAERATAWALRGRAAEEEGRLDEAVRSYRRALDEPTGLEASRRTALRIRLARSLAEAGALDASLEALAAVSERAPEAGSWLALEVARRAAEEGRVRPARRAVASIGVPAAGREAWDVMGRAHLAAGDTAAALTALLPRPSDGTGDAERAAAWSLIGRIRLARGERGPARQAFRNALTHGPDAEAARGLLDLGVETADAALRVFAALEDADEEAALAALERYAEFRVEALPDTLRLDRGRLLAEVGRRKEAVEELRELASRDERTVAAPALDLWSRVVRRQGRAAEARRIQDRLVARFPSHPEAVEVVFFRADDRHDRGDFSGALDAYQRAAGMAPELERAGLARMRAGQIHVTRGQHAEAARVFEGYLEDSPRGRYREEAAFWAARMRAARGETERARSHVRAIQEEDPLSYYSVLGARLLGERFDPPISEGTPPPRVPAIAEELDRIGLLRDAGLEAAVSGRIRALRRRYDASQDTLLRLSLELSEAGFSLDGITLGWELRRRGRAWDRWLARAVYPFPYRELVRLEAEEWGLEPLYLAGLIRQESAFLAGARSGAGAMGLMQVVPSTGRSLARRVGMEPFSEHLLLNPEVNLHLGASFLARLSQRFDGRTPLVLAAYNAGPTRARRWENAFPEVEDPLRFTERIPYRETRSYVKRVTRNVELYRWLYGEADRTGVEARRSGSDS